MRHGRRGEVVFATGMTGYQEICTDPSYRGQMVVLTYPLIGNYGVTLADVESRRPWLSALIVREASDDYSNWRASASMDDYLAATASLASASWIPARSRATCANMAPCAASYGSMRRARRQTSRRWWPRRIRCIPSPISMWSRMSRSKRRIPGRRTSQRQPGAPRVLLIDTGYKQNIARSLARRGLEVVIAPHTVTLADVRRINPDGVLLSNGPGDPESVANLVELTRALVWEEKIPLMGICLGHQILGLAAGARTSRLLFGHHGVNHPVREVRTGRVTVTSQNHNFQVDAATIPAASGLYVSHVNLSDGSVEGMAHETLPVFSVQYHPEAAPGPEDNQYLFDRFAAMVGERRRVALPVVSA